MRCCSLHSATENVSFLWSFLNQCLPSSFMHANSRCCSSVVLPEVGYPDMALSFEARSYHHYAMNVVFLSLLLLFIELRL